MPQNSHLEWKVPYAPGTLMARGYRGGKEVAVAKVETTGPPARIKLLPDRRAIKADGEDVSLVTVEVVDAQGRIVPAADNEVSFQIAGGKIIGVGNGDPSSHEPDKASQRKVFNGMAQVIAQSSRQPGDMVLAVASPGFPSATVKIRAERCALRPAVP
jgi:beta-galactosidase